MRGKQEQQGHLFSYVSLEDRVPADHPLRRIKTLLEPLLRDLSGVFNGIYSEVGRPSIPPEYLIKASLLQMLYSVRSERLLVEEINYNLLFRWFIGLSMDAAIWDHSVFTKNRDRLLEGEVATKLLDQVVGLAESHGLLSDEHFSVDGTLLEAWASHKSFQVKDRSGDPPSSDPDDPGNATVNFRGQKRTNATHQSTTDPEARLFRKGKGKEARLSFMGHTVIDNRHGLIVASIATQPSGRAEREAGIAMMRVLRKRLVRTKRRSRRSRVTLGADKSYDCPDFVAQLRDIFITPHVAQNLANNRTSAIDARTTRHPGYHVSQRKRKEIEESFGWLKVVALLRKIKLKGVALVDFLLTLGSATYDLLRISNILTAQQPET